MNTYNFDTLFACRPLIARLKQNLAEDEQKALRSFFKKIDRAELYQLITLPNEYGVERYRSIFNTLMILMDEMKLKNAAILAMLLYGYVRSGAGSIEQLKTFFGDDVTGIVQGLVKVNELNTNENTLGSDSYLKLLLSFAQDMRVVLIMIANRLYLLRCARRFEEAGKLKISLEVFYLYIPLAHKLGLYKIKSEMEDLYLKYTNRQTFDFISGKLSESKDEREAYIARFIAPIVQRLSSSGLKYDIKGRTKSIYSINNKLIKQKTDFEHIYDLFAIRIIIDTDLQSEKAACWQVYSVVTDLYQPNPKRLKDWLSIPKSNGYESLHITVMGQESRWVEVQIRTRRMDEIAENGLAAHWKYKGVKNQSNVDQWLQTLREALEHSENNAQAISDFRLDAYSDEIYVFTPKGDLHTLPKGATVLDFAYAIHSGVGSKCISGRINGKNVSIRQKLNSGDQVEIVTSPSQSPKHDWLQIVRTSRAKNRIRQALKESENKQVALAKELLKRRFKNRKIEEDEATLSRLIKKMGYKTVTEFYVSIADGQLDVNAVLDNYMEFTRRETEQHSRQTAISAENYVMPANETPVGTNVQSKDELIIDRNLTGIEYQLARCCNPIYGDAIFGFVSSHGIRIHRQNCPNAPDMFSRFAYRVIPARWSSNVGAQYMVLLRVTGNDDIGIVTNLTSIIGKENDIQLRSINIDSHDGLFQGNLTVSIANVTALNSLLKKLRTVKGVKSVERVS